MRVAATSVPASGASSGETSITPPAASSSAQDTVPTGANVLRTASYAPGDDSVSGWKVPDSAVLVRSETHFAPEAAAGSALPSQNAAPSLIQAEAAGQADLALLQQQFASGPATPNADLSTDIQARITAEGSPPIQPGSAQPAALMGPLTQAASNAAQQPDTHQDGSSFADALASSPASVVPNLGGRVAPSTGRGATSDGSAKDTASRRDQSSSSTAPTAPTEAQLTSELGALFSPEAGSGSPARQIFDGIQRAVSSPAAAQASTDTEQTTLYGQQPLKTITLALSPQALGMWPWSCRSRAEISV